MTVATGTVGTVSTVPLLFKQPFKNIIERFVCMHSANERVYTNTKTICMHVGEQFEAKALFMVSLNSLKNKINRFPSNFPATNMEMTCIASD